MQDNWIAASADASALGTARLGAYTAIAGAICALVGAGLWISTGSGTDLDAALVQDDVAGYLTAVGENQTAIIANLVIWIVMAFLLGIAGTSMAALGRQRASTARVGAYCYYVGVPVVITAYSAWLAIVVRLAPDASAEAIMLTDVMGWFAVRADWIATILIVGIGPTFVALAGRGTWAPGWLVIWSYVTAVTAALNAAAMLTGGAGLSTYGFAIIPVGVLWMIAAGTALLRWRPGGRGLV